MLEVIYDGAISARLTRETIKIEGSACFGHERAENQPGISVVRGGILDREYGTVGGTECELVSQIHHTLKKGTKNIGSVTLEHFSLVQSRNI
jgi:hypothetical protein